MSEQTTTINGRGGPELFKALAAFQKTKPVAKMDAVNPHFKSKYATLASVTDAAQGAAAHGLSVVQLVGVDTITTMLCHVSGQYVSTETPILATKDNAHGFGAGCTYSRRFSLSAILGIAADEDDDGNAAVESQRKAKHSPDFKEDKTKFMWPRLKELGLDQKEVNDYVVTFKKKRLSALSKEEVERLITGLSDGRSVTSKHFKDWKFNRENPNHG